MQHFVRAKIKRAMNKRIRNHHFVPRVLQKQFACEDGRIWYSRRGDNSLFDPPELRNTKSAFRIRDYYTVLKDGEPSDDIEKKFYGSIDDYWGRAVPEIMRSFDNSEIPTFTGEPLESIRRVVLEMIKRTPEFTGKYDDTKTGREVVESTLATLSHDPENEEYQSALKDLNNPNRLKDIGRTVRVKATIKRSDKVDNALSDFSVRWAVSESRHSYILSSKMVYRIGNGGPNGLSNPNMEIWMPISPQIALVLLRVRGRRIPHLNVDTPNHIRQVNEYAVSTSNHIASHSERLLKSLTGR